MLEHAQPPTYLPFTRLPYAPFTENNWVNHRFTIYDVCLPEYTAEVVARSLGSRSLLMYSTRQLIWNRRSAPGCTYYLIIGVLYPNFRINTPEFLFFFQMWPAFVIARFLARGPVLYSSCVIDMACQFCIHLVHSTTKDLTDNLNQTKPECSIHIRRWITSNLITLSFFDVTHPPGFLAVFCW